MNKLTAWPVPVTLFHLKSAWGKISAVSGSRSTARGHRYRRTPQSAKRPVLPAGDNQDALRVGWDLGQRDVGAHVFPRGDDILPIPPYLGELLFEVDLLVGTEGVGTG